MREKPVFIKRTRDFVLMTELKLMEELLRDYDLHAGLMKEEDGTVTVSLEEIDLTINAETEVAAKIKIQEEIYQYSLDYYDNFDLWSKAPNRRKHMRYVLRALILNDDNKIGEMIKWQFIRN